jgi:hypothetical protein
MLTAPEEHSWWVGTVKSLIQFHMTVLLALILQFYKAVWTSRYWRGVIHSVSVQLSCGLTRPVLYLSKHCRCCYRPCPVVKKRNGLPHHHTVISVLVMPKRIRRQGSLRNWCLAQIVDAQVGPPPSPVGDEGGGARRLVPPSRQL